MALDFSKLKGLSTGTTTPFKGGTLDFSKLKNLPQVSSFATSSPTIKRQPIDLEEEKKGFFTPTPKVRIRDVAREIPGATKNIAREIGQSMMRNIASFIGSESLESIVKPITDKVAKLEEKNPLFRGFNEELATRLYGDLLSQEVVELTGETRGEQIAPIGERTLELEKKLDKKGKEYLELSKTPGISKTEKFVTETLGSILTERKGDFAPIIIGGFVGLDLTFGGGSKKTITQSLKNINKVDDAFDLLRKMNVPEDLARFHANDVVKIKSTKEADKFIENLENTLQTTRMSDTSQTVKLVDEVSDPLTLEARKYKSAEEFVKLPKIKTDQADYLTNIFSKVKNAEIYAKEGKRKFVLRDVENITPDFTEVPASMRSSSDFRTVKDFIVKFKDGTIDRYRNPVFEISEETKSQLTDIWERANRGVTPVRSSVVPRPIADVKYKDLDEIAEAVRKRDTTKEGLDDLRTSLAFAEESIEQSPAKQLVKYAKSTIVDGKTGKAQLPEVTGRAPGQTRISEFGRRGDDIVTELGFRDVDEAQEALEQYTKQKQRINGLKKQISDLRNLRSAALKGETLMRLAVGDRKALVRNLRDRFGLTDSELRSISNNRDIRLMNNYEFKRFIDNLDQKAVEVADTRQAKAELMDLRNRMEFTREEAYRQTQGLPPISEMNSTELRQYAEALEQFQVGDEFLTKRTLEVVDRTNLAGVKTIREAQERLLKEIEKQTGKKYTVEELKESVKVSAFDNLRFDTALAERNPFYGYIVERTQANILSGQANFLQVQDKVNDLARKANKSRDRGFLGTIRQALIPKQEEVIRYLEAPVADKPKFAQALTKEELDYANYVEKYYSDAYEHLVSIKELYGSRFVDQYFTHTRKTFLEEWSDNGIVSAFRNFWKSHKEDQIVANIIDQDTGMILPKSKFFQYTLQRTGEIEPSQNLTRVFLQYSRSFERKKMFDQMIPEIDIYTQSLTPKNLTPKGLEMDRRLKTFINKYLNNKKGRKETFGGIVKQNGPADMAIRLGNTLVSLRDLGLNIAASVAATVGEQVMTYQALGKLKYVKAWKRRLWDTGIERLADKNANKILKEAEPFIGRNIWKEIADADIGFGDRAIRGVYGLFSQSSVEANKLFLLGSISKSELKSGKLSAGRLAQLRLEAGRWRDMGRDVKSIVGSTSLGEMSTKYKGWAIPIARTTIKDTEDLSKMLLKGDFKKALTSREAAELYRAIEMSVVLVGVGGYVIGNADDDSFIGKLRARAYMEAMTFLGGIDPTLFLATPRLYNFLQDLAANLKKIVQLERYQQDTRFGDEGELKGVKGIQRLFTPRAFGQFESSGGETSSGGGRSAEQIFKDLGLPELPSADLPPLPKLPSL